MQVISHVGTGFGRLRNIPVFQSASWVPFSLRNSPPWLLVLTP